MSNPAYYNEHDEDAADWLRSLIKHGHIAPGDVDTRSIEDVTPDDLTPYTQCHFFAGLGGWSAALRRAGWADDRRIWTGSAPCQPFSAAGAGNGFDDERHLWPAFHWLIEQCRPPIVTGEQVASKPVDDWIDLVHADMEGLAYAFASAPFPSASVGAPHIRDRNFWMGHANSIDTGRHTGAGHCPQSGFILRAGCELSGASGGPCRLGHMHHTRPQGYAGHDCAEGRCRPAGSVAPTSLSCGLADCDASGCGTRRAIRSDGAQCDFEHGSAARGMADAIMQQRQGWEHRISDEHIALGWLEGAATPAGLCGDMRPGPVNGFWRDADWLFCRDGKWRPVEPGTFPLAHGLPRNLGALAPELQRLAAVAGLDAASLKRAKQYRTGGLKAYGNAINIEAAVAFIRSWPDAPVTRHRLATSY